jgi:hypothetical protein
VPVCSRAALAPFTSLTPSSGADNLLLEMRIALELMHAGELSGIYPVLVGDKKSLSAADAGLDEVYGDFFRQTPPAKPACVGDVVVDAVEKRTAEQLQRAGARCAANVRCGELRTGREYDECTVARLLDDVLRYQGTFLRGLPADAVEKVVGEIEATVRSAVDKRAERAASAVVGGSLSEDGSTVWGSAMSNGLG